MSNRKSLWLATLALPVLMLACGGGAKEEAPAFEESAGNAPATTATTAGSAPAAAAAAPAGGAAIAGTVKLDGAAPPMEKIRMDADNYCKSQHSAPVESQQVVDNNGSLQWVLVYVKSGLPAGASYAAPSDPVVLDQDGCMYKPHVFGVRAGQPVKIVNSDATLHNIHPLPAVNTAFNIGMPLKGMSQTKTFDKPELPPFHIKCDVHKWMSAYCGVFDNPFFTVTDASGNFKISGLPAGTYVVESWQEKYGTQDQTVTVQGTETKTADFTYKAS